jgi:hypothetical protein
VEELFVEAQKKGSGVQQEFTDINLLRLQVKATGPSTLYIFLFGVSKTQFII